MGEKERDGERERWRKGDSLSLCLSLSIQSGLPIPPLSLIFLKYSFLNIHACYYCEIYRNDTVVIDVVMYSVPALNQ